MKPGGSMPQCSPIIPILSRVNPISRIDTYFFRIHSNIVLPSTPVGVPVKILKALLPSSILVAYIYTSILFIYLFVCLFVCLFIYLYLFPLLLERKIGFL